MILVDQTQAGRGVTPRAGPLVPEEPAPSVGETLGAAFQLENDIVAGFNLLTEQNDFEPDPDTHNPLEVIRGTEYEAGYLDNFVGSRSEAETRSIMSRIDRENKLRSTLDRGGAWGWIANVAAGVVSPTVLIPVSKALPLAKAGLGFRSAVRAGQVGAVTAGATAVQEGFLQTAQETRTAEESLASIGIAGGFGLFLGAGSVVVSGAIGGAAQLGKPDR